MARSLPCRERPHRHQTRQHELCRSRGGTVGHPTRSIHANRTHHSGRHGVGQWRRRQHRDARDSRSRSRWGAFTAVDRNTKEQMLRRLGADHFIDFEKASFTAMDRTYDVIFDMVAGSSYAACIRTLRPGGEYLLQPPPVRHASLLRYHPIHQQDRNVRISAETKAVNRQIQGNDRRRNHQVGINRCTRWSEQSMPIAGLRLSNGLALS